VIRRLTWNHAATYCRTGGADADDGLTVAGAVEDPESVVSQVHMYVAFLIKCFSLPQLRKLTSNPEREKLDEGQANLHYQICFFLH
jgi:hypothetical protein